ncbi:MAG TPA: hypothetical protein VH643_22340 [Gemmataceae bacterium]|jgi:hypothetical protein
MAGYGTAPRRIRPGIWQTRKGRALTPAGSAYWEHRFQAGLTDGLGRVTAGRNTAKVTQASAPIKKPGFGTYARGARGDPEAIAQVKLYNRSKQARDQQQQAVEAETDRRLGISSPAFQKSARATRLHPVASAVIKSLSPTTSLEEAGRAIRKGNVPEAALALSSVFPVGRGARLATGVERAVKAEKAAKAAERTLQIGERAQHLTPARSRLTRALVEKPADAASRMFPNLPLAGARSRAFKAAGREERIEQGRAGLGLIEHVHVLPKKGSNDDVAAFWWAQLPKSERNVAGLVKVRNRLRRELDEMAGGTRYVSRRQTKKFAAGQQVEARSLAASIARLNKVIAAKPKLNERTIEAVHALSGDRERILAEHGLLAGETAENRKGVVSHYLGLDQSGEEAYIGHRVGRVRGAGGVRSVGVGKVAKVAGLQPNTMRLLRSGGMRQSTHVAAEDWNASQTYQNAKRIRDTLWQMGDKYEGHLPDGYLLVNPHGKTVPAAWKHDVVSELGSDHPDLADTVKEMLGSFVARKSESQAMLDEAKAGGYLDQLRVVPEKDVRRFYSQFLPAGQRNALGKGYDTAVDAMANSLIFARLGYIPKNVVQNLVTAIPHQGVRLFANVPRAVQLVPHPTSSELDRKLWSALVHESGAGSSGIVAQESAGVARRASSFIPSKVTAVADQPLRVSAFLHEAAAEKVIPKYAVHLSEDDKQALLDLLTDPERRPQLNRIMQRSRDAMADFERLTPSQRRLARRFLIVPGWLTAGTRYPIHFAVTHPGRSAALAYVAAGEPGAPDRLQVNRPIDEYLAEGLPPFVPAVGLGGNSVERIGSVLPASIPADVAFNARAGGVTGALDTLSGETNPLGEALWNIAHRTVPTISGEAKHAAWQDVLERNLRSLAPSEQEVENIATGKVSPGSMYQGGRLNTLARAAGVAPVKINKANAERELLSSQGMTKSVATVSDREKFYAALADAGYHNPAPALRRAYDLRLERAKRLDRIDAHGLAYQQKAYRADIGLAVKHGLITKEQAQASLRHLPQASEQEIEKSRDWIGDHLFGGQTITQAKRELREATG